jgi:hypothetical protein
VNKYKASFFLFISGGKDWYMREKAILLTPDEFRFKDSVPDFLQSQVKICEGEMFNVFPLLRLLPKNIFILHIF